ncbi:hypothetical protein AS188_05735 [Kocuria flava]|uniref:Signal peptidase I n=1 Tax=Kocuria flava TaxID=446860 RepID=A0A0U3HWQ6_9MICC|nr:MULTISPECIES: signal peptidase I [Kocuria]ALU39335.1 hypothetical protein AS188_05735 [Kocuria flava]MCD1145988.1 signal peptidase I [Kocuria sp. LUK]GEO92952.1 hypothetical protein KFL01_22580 [Kocuria flava]
MSRVLHGAARTVLLGLLAVVAALLLATVAVPRALGWVPLTVVSGSMEPAVPTGSQVVVEPLEGPGDAERLAVGDVVTFMPRPDDATLVTHRVVAIAQDGEGRRSFTTRGDANDAADEGEITHVQLRGLVRYHVPWAGHLATALDPGQKRAGTVAVAAALGGYALWQLGAAVRERTVARARAGRP